jgi:hypothetical protein
MLVPHKKKHMCFFFPKPSDLWYGAGREFEAV